MRLRVRVRARVGGDLKRREDKRQRFGSLLLYCSLLVRLPVSLFVFLFVSRPYKGVLRSETTRFFLACGLCVASLSCLAS